MIRVLWALVLGLLVGCGEKIQDAPEPGVSIQLPTIEWKILDQPALLATYQHNAGMLPTPIDPKKRHQLAGFVGTRPDGGIVIVTPPPRYVDDEVTCTLGHEVLHVALGDYHKEVH